LSTFACSIIVSISAFSWLRFDFPRELAVGLELTAVIILGIDILLNRRELASFVKSFPGLASTVLGVTPWYSLSFLIGYDGHHPLYVLLTHASFAPYLLFRYRHFAREHIVPQVVKVLFGVNFFVLTIHWLATIWMLLQPRTNVDFFTEYNMAVYYLMTTIATVGYGDIAPNDNASRVFTMVLELMGVCAFGLVISQLSRMILNADRRKELAQSEMQALVSLVKHYDIPPDLRKRSYQFLRYLLQTSSNEEELRVLSRLPQALQNEIRTYMNAKPLAKVSLFRSCSQQCILDAAHELKQEFYNAGQSIFRKGEHGSSMFVIGHGRVRIHDGDKAIAELDDGHCFGEMALINDDSRTADVTTITHCDLFVLSKERFCFLLENHRDLRENVERMVHARDLRASA
jgi:voltage-gated potassium channel